MEKIKVALQNITTEPFVKSRVSSQLRLLAELTKQPKDGHLIPNELLHWVIKCGFTVEHRAEDGMSWWIVKYE
jgi:hypothetical protein